MSGKFRQDLYYRLSTVPIFVPPLRERKEDIHLLFRKFASDAAEKYRMPFIQLDEDAIPFLVNYRWPGNIRQLKNVTEQISIIEKNRQINADTLLKYLPQSPLNELPVLYKVDDTAKISERELLYKVLFDMKRDMTDLKQLVMNLIESENLSGIIGENQHLLQRLYKDQKGGQESETPVIVQPANSDFTEPIEELEEVEESLSLQKQEKETIIKALQKYEGKRKEAAKQLGISERTLYRKIREYNIQ